MEEIYVFDIEGDGFLDTITKIHCLTYSKLGSNKKYSTTNYQEMRDFFTDSSKIKCGHNIIRYDLQVVEKILGIKIPKGLVIDTLPLSWYIFTDIKKHGLEEWGERFGIKKPEIKDWSNLTSVEYIHRCEEDVKINLLLAEKEIKYLNMLYSSEKEILRLFRYFQFKMECIRDQEAIGLKLDVKHCEDTLKKLELEKEEKIKELAKAMPKVPIQVTRTIPKVLTKKDGTLSSHGANWYKLLEEEGHPTNITQVQVIVGYSDPNPNSHEQIKSWLYSLGWKPQNIKHVRDKKTGSVRKIPQIGAKVPPGQASHGEICDSIKLLFDKEPTLELLNGLSILSHRIAMFKAFLKDHKNGRLEATMNGLTNTLRLQHMTVVNLPGIDKKYGYEVRRSIISDDGHLLCGSDLSNIEDKTKRHFIYKYDPQYVEDMNVPGYDSHLEIGKLAGIISQEQIDFYTNYNEEANNSKKEIEEYKNIKGVRNKAKIVNFSATYKIGAEALARNSGMSVKEARNLLDIYWERNKAIKQVENSCEIKEIGGQKWLKNPISGYWYSLRTDKDRFSTLNQGSAAYVFDIWITYLRQLGIKPAMQYHDEVLFNVPKGKEEEVKNKISEAMKMTNERLKLNIEVTCSTKFSDNYADCH
jgi:hypothetical protein